MLIKVLLGSFVFVAPVTRRKNCTRYPSGMPNHQLEEKETSHDSHPRDDCTYLYLLLGGSSQDLDTWLVTMVSKSPKWGYSPSKLPKWLINGGY